LLVAPGDAVVTSDGAYPTFNYHVAGFGGVLHKVPYRGDAEDPEALIARAREVDAKLVYFANPDNPMGSWHDAATVQAMIDALPEGTVLALDEAYADTAPAGAIPPLDMTHPRVIRFRTFSKAYGLAGMRLGYGIAPPALAARIQQRKRAFHISTAGMAAAIAALQDAEHLDRTPSNHHQQLEVLTAGLQAMGLETTPSQANFVMSRCPAGHDAESLTRALVEQAVMVRPAFDLPQHIRATVGTPDGNARLLAALSAILGQ
jgi:histidinol-phosphate aminotransferase